MATLRVEILGDLQMSSCERCEWATIGDMPGSCPCCREKFTRVRLLTENKELRGEAEEDFGPFSFLKVRNVLTADMR